MSNDKNDKAGGWFGNPLPIVMVVLLAAGVLVKNVPLESARPSDPERVKFVPTSQQDVEARLWQDPFAAVEKHEKLSDQAVTPAKETSPAPHTPQALHKRIKTLHDKVTVVATSVFGGSFDEAAESRRRTRFAVVSALGAHDYSPENADAIGYFRITLPKPNAVNLTVPYEWFKKRDESSNVLVLWLNEDILSTTRPLNELHHLFNELKPPDLAKGLRVKLIGPAGSAMLAGLVRENKLDLKLEPIARESSSRIEVFSSSATISSCDLKTSTAGAPKDKLSWSCFMMKNPTQLTDLTTLPIIRTTGTDDVLSAALLWELWQRGVNRDSLWKRIWATFAKGPGDTTFPRRCKDGLVLISEWDTEYGRTLSQNLNDGFSSAAAEGTSSDAGKPPCARSPTCAGWTACSQTSTSRVVKRRPKTRTANRKTSARNSRIRRLSMLRGAASSTTCVGLPTRSIGSITTRISSQKNGVKAIGIVGSDVYDKLLILQALRSRFKDKIFFTTDLDARYLHADQKDWARNLVVASNFGLSLRPALQYFTLPFRDSYQTATYLATQMALENQPFDHWTGTMKEWLRPQLFEIGRTEAVHLASPSVERLREWIKSDYAKDPADAAKDTKCTRDLAKCESIEPDWPSRGLSLEHPWATSFMIWLGLLLVALSSRRLQETMRTACNASAPEYAATRATISRVIGAVVVVFIILTVVWWLINDSLAHGVGEPFVWLEGISVWPSLIVRFLGVMTMLALCYVFLKRIQQQEKFISTRFEFPLPQTWTLARSRRSAVRTGPHLDLESFDRDGKADQKPAGAAVEIVTLWQNYLRATRWREMAGWVLSSMLLVGGLGFTAFSVFGKSAFPHRGQLVETLHYILVFLNGPVLWLVIFWVSYETRACARFIETLSSVPNIWPTVLLNREETETGVPRAHLDDHLAFQVILLATQRIHWLIYLPFVQILFMVVSRSDLFDTMDFPLALVFVTGLALAFALHSVVLLRRSAESARTTAIAHYETQLLTQARAKDSQRPAAADGAAASPARQPISAEQIKILMERIRSTREGAFAPIPQQPALQALLLPFGSYGGVQLIEYLFKL